MIAIPSLDHARHALFLDFDGTLAPIQDDPATVFLSPERTRVLSALANTMAHALAVLSGRSLRDLSARIPNDILRIGSHGLEVGPVGIAASPGSGQAPSALHDAICEAAFRFDDVWIEPKGSVIAIHYRANPDCAPQLDLALRAVIADYPEYSLQGGKMVFEAKPAGANKGKALERAMLQKPFVGRIPVMLGDDRTDEDAIATANSLGGFGVKIGSGHTCASWRLADVDAVWTWLEGTS